MSKEEVEKIFNESKSNMRNYFTTLPDDNNFNEFQLQYDNSIKSLILFIVTLDNTYTELNRWKSFNLTMFKQLISLADKFSKIELWDNIPILLSMRL